MPGVYLNQVMDTFKDFVGIVFIFSLVILGVLTLTMHYRTRRIIKQNPDEDLYEDIFQKTGNKEDADKKYFEAMERRFQNKKTSLLLGYLIFAVFALFILLIATIVLDPPISAPIVDPDGECIPGQVPFGC